MQKVLLATLLMLLTGSAVPAETVREFKGSRNATTAVFTVEAPWLLDWRLDGPTWQSDGRASKFSALEITLIEAGSGRHVGRVVYTKMIGNGVRLFERAGSYQLKVSTSHGRWSAKIQELTPEEARQYSPREAPQI